MSQLFCIGEPVKTIVQTKPMPERFFVAAYLGSDDGYWRIWKDLWHTQEAAEKAANALASCWIERRIYRIPGDEPCPPSSGLDMEPNSR